ncbi:MAG: chemotaxis protein CheW [Kofleriaceae bacterium]
MADSGEVLRARARRLARPVEETTGGGGASAIVATIGSQQYAFALTDVRRAAVLGALTPLPHLPPIVLGLGISDGDVVAVFDARVWTGSPRRPPSNKLAVLLLGSTIAPLALAVDAFAGTITLEPVIRPAAASTTSWLRGVTADGVLVVDVPALLQDPLFSFDTQLEGPR